MWRKAHMHTCAHVRIHAHTHTPPTHTVNMHLIYAPHDFSTGLTQLAYCTDKANVLIIIIKNNNNLPLFWDVPWRTKGENLVWFPMHTSHAAQCTEQIHLHRGAPCQSQGCGQHLHHGHFVIVLSRKALCCSLHTVFYTICVIYN